MNHTPGPWEADQVGQVWGKINNRDVRVADMGSFNMNANARLIAAAPDLLDALRCLADLCDGRGEFTLNVREAYAAIAKAEGRDE